MLHRQIVNKSVASDYSDLAETNSTDSIISQTAQFLQIVINNVSSALLIEDAEYNIAFVNEAYCQLFGIQIPVSEIIGENETFVNKLTSDIHLNYSLYKVTIDTLTHYKVTKKDVVIELIDGRVLELDYTPIFINNEHIGHIFNYKNITEKNLSAKRLQAQRRLFETILTNLPVDVAVFNPNYSDLFLNPIAIKDAELRKWVIDWMIGKDTDLLHGIPQNNTGNRVYFNQVLKTKNLVSWEEEKENFDSETEYYLRNMFPVLDDSGEIIMIIGYNVNITDRKKIEEKIKLSEKRYRDLINYSNALICTHDLSGKIITINPAISLLLEYTNNEVIGTNIANFLTSKSKQALDENYFTKVNNKGGASGVFSVLSKTNKKYYLLFQNYKVTEGENESYIVLFAQDITDRINAEKELLVAQKMTEKAALAKEAFLANMSHEIRTPMNGIMGVTSLLAKTELNKLQKNYLKLISDSAKNLLVIVNDVLDIEKIASGKLELEKTPFNIVEKVHNAVQSFQYKTEEKGLRLVFTSELPDNLITVGDPYRLIQILNNLINNAIKFTEQGEIVIHVAIEYYNDIDALVIIRIQDTGIGINTDRLEAIFDPYIQASSDTTRKYGGTGLGLSICKNLVEMQGGSINVNSTVGVGTTFKFALPYTISNEVALPAKTAHEIIFTGLEGKHILIAEDVELNQFLATTLLEGWGCIATVVENGKEAVESIEKNNFDLILMDVHMPEMDGIQATSHIRKMQNTQKATLPIIALTANALKGTQDVYLDAGMNYYISKPYTEKDLFVLICNALQITIQTNETTDNDETSISLNGHNVNLYDASSLEAMSKGKPDFVKRMVEIFISSIPNDMAKLNTATQEHDWDAVGKIAHRMKPSIDGMGIIGLKKIIRQVEQLGKEAKNTTEIPAMVQTTIATLDKVLAQLRVNYGL